MYLRTGTVPLAGMPHGRLRDKTEIRIDHTTRRTHRMEPRTFMNRVCSMLVAGVILSGGSLLQAQTGDIRGIISDSTNGERVPFATVMIRSLEKGAPSNINGFYFLTSVPAGRHEITASSIGFISRTVEVTVRAGQTAVVNIDLVPQPVEFSEVVVTEKARRQLEEINTSIHILDISEIKAVPVALQPDVFRAIQILPGIVSTSDVNTHFYVRGGAGDQNLILLDGMRIYNPFHAFGLLSIFDADIIKTTEVYTGAHPPGYGGRLSSVVNMLTKDGNRRTLSGKVEANLVSSKLQLEGPVINDVRFLFSGRVSTFRNALGYALDRDLPLSFYDAFLKVTNEDLETHSRYGVSSFFSGDNLRSGSGTSPDYRWRNSSTGFSGGGLIDDRLFVDVLVYENDFKASRIAKASSVSPASTRVRETGIKANATSYTDSRDVYYFGFEFTFPTLEYRLVNTLGTPLVLKSSYVDFWTWVRYEAHLGPVRLDGGLHVDVGSIFQRDDAGIDILEPRVNLSALLTEGWRLKLSYGQYSQHVITVNNEDDVVSIFDAWIRVPDEIHSERATHYVAGLDGNISKQLSTGVQAYYKDYGSLVAYNRDKVDETDPDYVRGTGASYGLEFLIRHGLAWNDVFATYTLGWATISNGGISYPPSYDRRHAFKVLDVVHITDELELTMRWEYGSGFPFSQSIGYYDRLPLTSLFEGSLLGEKGTAYLRLGEKNASRLPSYHRLDMSLTYSFTIGSVRGSAGVHVVNAYNQKNLLYFDRTTGERTNMLPFFPSVTVSLEY